MFRFLVWFTIIEDLTDHRAEDLTNKAGQYQQSRDKLVNLSRVIIQQLNSRLFINNPALKELKCRLF